MTDDKILENLRWVTSELYEARQQLHTTLSGPVAIVGMGCRYPGGVTSPEGLWDLVAAEVDAISGFPTDRGWELPAGLRESYARAGGFVTGAGDFDAGFFGISPREALAMDPQQRLILETTWEALEYAGITPESLRGSATGVFVGVTRQDYGPRLHQVAADAEAGGYLLTGTVPSVVSGRVAYVLGLAGPAVSVDTACSSSLVALHQAVQSIRSGECSLALVGGVSVMPTPGAFVEFARQGGMAPDGRCKPFADAADGTGWAEGAGVLVIERLSEAHRLGHRVLAVVRGSAINQDGASNGLAAPNGLAQQRVIRQALANAGVSAAEVDVVEAHGTGTTLGDPIEARALLATYGQDRPRHRPLWLGAIKSNFGHSQAAAGVAGVIKMVQALRHGILPKTLHVDAPSSHVDWSSGAVELLTEAKVWPQVEERPRRAGVSAFGVSGTNAHIVLEQAPEPVENAPVGPIEAVPWVVSGRSDAALRAQARRLHAWLLAHPEQQPCDVGWSLATTRSRFEYRAVVLGSDRAELIDGVAALADGGSAPGVVRGVAGDPGRTVFVFPGQGAQWVGMGVELSASAPVFAAKLAECAEVLAPLVDWSLLEVLRAADGAPSLDRVDVVQPVLFAMMVSLAELWRSVGVSPDAVVGHSQGEIAAAYVAGALSLADAARIVVVRSRALTEVSGQGAMASIGLSPSDVRERLAGRAGVVVAAVNGPATTVVSGVPDALDRFLSECEAEGVYVGRVAVDYASHSPQVEPLRERLLADFGTVAAASSAVAFYSTVTGGVLDSAQLDAEYWFRNLRETVHFDIATQALLTDGYRLFVETSPHPVLTAGIEQSCASADVLGATTIVPTLRRTAGGPAGFLISVAQVDVTGIAEVRWATVFDSIAPRRVPLPTYAFQRRRFWLDSDAGTVDVRSLGLAAADHPLAGAVVSSAESGEVVITGRISPHLQPWLADHVAAGVTLFPGTGFVELAVRAADIVGCGQVRELTLEAPLVLVDAVQIQVVVSGPEQSGERAISVYSRADGADWIAHARGVLSLDDAAADCDWAHVWPPVGATPIDTSGVYEKLATAGYEFGPAFQGLRSVWRRGDELFVAAALPETVTETSRFVLHPALLDAVLHGRALTGASGELMLPFVWRAVSVHAGGASALRARLVPAENGAVSIVAVDDIGDVVLTGSVTMRRLRSGQLGVAGPREQLYAMRWRRLGAVATASAAELVTFADAESARAGLRVLEAVPPVVVLDVRAVPDTDMPTNVRAAVDAVLSVLQEWLRDNRFRSSTLLVVTRAAVGADVTDLAGAAIWGLVRAAQAEDPGRIVLLDTDGTGDFAQLVSIVLASGEPQIMVRDGVPHAARLTRVPRDADAAPVADTDRLAEGTVVITGGTSGLGAIAARHLVTAYGVPSVLLASRRGPAAPGVAELSRELAELGARVRIIAADVSERAAVAGLLAAVPDDFPLIGIVHAAGVLDDGVIAALTPERVHPVLAAKVDAAWHLHELTRDRDLAMFVLFSTAAGVLGSAGQGNYAAANVFLDGLAAQRYANGLAATSIAWGLWRDDTGLTGHLAATDTARLGRNGVLGLSTDQGVALFDAALTGYRAEVVAVRWDRAALTAQAAAGTLAPALQGLVTRTRRTAAAGSGVAETDPVRRWQARLSGATAVRQEQMIVELVRAEVAVVLGHDGPAAIDADRNFGELGLDSLMAVEVRNRLHTAIGLRLPVTLVFDYPTPKAVGGLVLRELLGGASDVMPTSRVAGDAASDPVVIVGIGCRYPGGVSSPDSLWDLVVGERDAVSGFPDDRGWDVARVFDPEPGEDGKTYVREGGFVHDAGVFDAGFFGISPREAMAMDPQQRLLLETSWEALEHAGIEPNSLRGSDTGVFVGLMYHDYPGSAGSGAIVSGRVAYALGLEGPAVSMDTACSSSLVALHQAVRAVRSGECSMALVGGVTVMATPEAFVAFSRQRGLAGDGRCKSFAEAADGTGFAEGVGVLVVESLSRARELGHEVLAVVRGTAVNQDGASNGLTAPNGPAQQRVIRRALADADLDPAEVDVVEAHGTGTTLGDPIEAQALLATYGRDRAADRPLWLGSLKSNIGHTQAAAGVAGVIKMVQAMRHGVLPRTLHVDSPSSHIDWTAGAVALLTDAQPWPDIAGRPRRAGVSAFGASGTNAHVIIEQAPDSAPAERSAVVGGVVPWVISAHSRDALAGQARRLAEFVRERPELVVQDVGWSLVTTRSRFEHRAVVIGTDRDELLARLSDFTGPGVVSGAADNHGKTVFVFPGQGGQWVGMGVDLLDSAPVFAAKLAECAEVFAPLVDWSLFDVLRGVDGAPSSDRVDVVQPALFAVLVSLAELWRSVGVTPDAVVGHSQGEIAAAYVAGALSLADAARIVVTRSRALTELSGRGMMASIGLSASDIRERFADRDDIVVAAVNGPVTTVVSGQPEAIGQFLTECAGEGVYVGRIAVDYASHSPQVEPLRERLSAEFGTVAASSSEVAFYSTVTGGVLDTGRLDAEYWFRNLRETVLFDDSVRALAGDGYGTFVEISPHPLLIPGIEQSYEAIRSEAAPVVVGTLRRDEDGSAQFLTAAAHLHVSGAAEVRWAPVFERTDPRRVALPTYAFQHRRYWLDASAGATDPTRLGLSATDHPLVRAAVPAAGSDGMVLTGWLSRQTDPWLAEHMVDGAVVFPNAGFIELAVRAGDEVGCARLGELTVVTPLALPSEGGVRIQVVVGDPDETSARPVSLYSRADAPGVDWMLHARGLLSAAAVDAEIELSAWPPPGARSVPVDGLYDRMAEAGFGYGPLFRATHAVWQRGTELFAEVELPETDSDYTGFGVHPALLEALAHATAIDGELRGADGAMLPSEWEGVTLHAAGASALRVRITPVGAHTVAIEAADAEGQPVLSIRSMRWQPVPIQRGTTDPLHAVRWRVIATTGPTGTPAFVEWTRLAPDRTPPAVVVLDLRRHALERPRRADETGADSRGARAVETKSGDDASLLGGTAESFVGSDVVADAGAATHVVNTTSGNLSGHRTESSVGSDAVADARAATDVAETVSGNLLGRRAESSAEPDVLADTHAVAHDVLAVLQEFARDERFASTTLLVCTGGAISIAGEGITDLPGTAVIGLVRTAQSEDPGRIVLVDSDGHIDHGDIVALALATGEPQVAIRDGVAYVARLERLTVATGAAPVADGTVLITGGTSGLGALVARHLVVEHGIRSLVLAGRRGPDAVGATESATELSELGARVRVRACDVSQRHSLAELVATIPDLTGVVHAAAVLDDGVIGSLTPDRIDAVLAAKADAAWYLHELTLDRQLSTFVLFSSMAGTTGSPGQGNYAAANTFLDGLAVYRRAAGLPATSIAWGLWTSDTGLTGRLGVTETTRMSRVGMLGLPTARGLALFDAAAAHTDAAPVAARFDTAALAARARRGELAPMLRELVPATWRAMAAHASTQSPQLDLGDLLGLVRTEIAALLGHDGPDAIDPDRACRDQGFDSLSAVETRNRLKTITGLALPVSLVFDYPTPRAIAEYLNRELGGRDADVAIQEPVRPATDEPVAIVGIGCRFPGGVRSADDLWQLLLDGRDAVSGFPVDRGWDVSELFDPDPDAAGKSYVREGGFVHDAGHFDAAFFGISPREAIAMDPQQRLFLETCWEAIEHAGIDPQSLRGSTTGVYVGVSSPTYGNGRLDADPDGGAEGYLLTGLSSSVVSGRVSYVLGLEGPAVSVDTACSSSLVALHQAVQSLRSGESSLALVGGVTVIGAPGIFVEFSRQRGLAADGRCKPFADAADGTGWAEGAGVLVVERLADAHRHGHKVLAVIPGIAVNQDGASNGLTAPNGPAQQRVIRQALAHAGIAAAEVDAVEAHGTGTRLGDPIEAHAVLATYGRDRREPLWLGSIKSNIGHTQAAAGMAGVIKMVQALRHGVLPKSLHVDSPSAQVDWSSGAVELLVEARAWPETYGRPRRAGVSAFGISGTNAHVIVEQAPVADGPAAMPDSGDIVPWVISARSEAALRAQARLLAGWVSARPGLEPADVGWSLVTSRSRFEHRAVVVGADRAELVSGLAAVADGTSDSAVVRGAMADAGELTLVFPGQGAQYVGMGRELHGVFPAFAAAFDEVVALLDARLGCSLTRVLWGDDQDALNATVFAQAGLFAVEVATYRLLESWGVRPDFVVGHSIGEVAAAHVAGVLSLADAVTLVAARGRLMQALPAGGAMVAVAAGAATVSALLIEGVGIAAVNGPDSVVISGVRDAVAVVADRMRYRGKRVTWLRVSHAFHSPLMEPMLGEFAEIVAGLSFSEPSIPVISNVTGALAGSELLAPDYWARQVRETVRFSDGIAALHDCGATRFVVAGPDGGLTGSIEQCFEGIDAGRLIVPVLRKDGNEHTTALKAIANMFVAGVAVTWDAVLGGSRPCVDLPTYAFQRTHYWLDPSPGSVRAAADPVDAEFWRAIEDSDPAPLGIDPSRSFGEVLPMLSAWREQRRAESATDSRRYRIEWKPLADNPVRPTGRWLVITADDIGRGVEIAAAFGVETLCVRMDSDLPSAVSECRGVISLLALDDQPSADAAISGGLLANLRLLQALRDAGVSVPVWFVTNGAVTATHSDHIADAMRAQVWGLGQVAGLEFPQWWGGMVDLPAQWEPSMPHRLAAAVSRDDGEDQLAMRASGTYARRMMRAPRTTGKWTPRGTVLVTGGTGGIGAHIARWLVANGAEHVVLVGRRGPQAPGAAELEAELVAAGGRVSILAADVTDRAAVASVLAMFDAELSAVIHAAGIAYYDPIPALDPAAVGASLAPKVLGAQHLNDLLGARRLDAFVLFSSGAATWGSHGAGGYAAGNAYLDALAEQRRSRGLVATSLAWGGWSGGGMADSAPAQQFLTRTGVGLLDPESALRAMAATVGSAETCVTIADIDWEQFTTLYSISRRRALIADLPDVRAALRAERDGPPDVAESELRVRLTGLDGQEQARVLLETVRAEVATVLGHRGPQEIAPDRNFADLGFDSLTAVETRNRLKTATGLRLSATLLFDHPTPRAVARYLHEELALGTADVDTAESDIRRRLARIPLARFRELGVLDALLESTSAEGNSPQPDTATPDALDAMDSADLVAHIMGNGRD
ncbi:type I polyketide synthase [Nocardia sp. NPDC052112]|uniref:type I polyketide synthase n=1 Tax=Nocardia sp. NPDC052112 TaxID=3155646 RepID=UPI0034380D11